MHYEIYFPEAQASPTFRIILYFLALFKWFVLAQWCGSKRFFTMPEITEALNITCCIRFIFPSWDKRPYQSPESWQIRIGFHGLIIKRPQYVSSLPHRTSKWMIFRSDLYILRRLIKLWSLLIYFISCYLQVTYVIYFKAFHNINTMFLPVYQHNIHRITARILCRIACVPLTGTSLVRILETTNTFYSIKL
jgi:hypothetical protein